MSSLSGLFFSPQQSTWFGLRWVKACFPIRNGVLFLLIGLAGLLQLVLPLWVSAAESVTAVARPGVMVGPVNPFSDIHLTRDCNSKTLNQIFQFDSLPLGNRLPVILMPGRAEEFQKDAWWKRFNRQAHRDKYFTRHYKLYVFLYNSKGELDEQASSMARQIKHFFGALNPSQPLTLITYSLGGVIARDILKDKSILNQVETIYAVAVPFHGTPIFDPAWFTEYLNPPNHSPIRRGWDKLFYQVYMFDKSNLRRDLQWDNFDHSAPQFNRREGFHIRGDQMSVEFSSMPEYANADEMRRKMVVYASYLDNPFTGTTRHRDNTPMKTPYYMNHSKLVAFLGTFLPMYGLTVHNIMEYYNYQLANLSTYTVEDPQGFNSHLYRFNDGVIPLSSMLFLTPNVSPQSEDPETMIEESQNKANIQSVRLFRNLDHVDMGEYHFMRHKIRRYDILHPSEGIHTPNHWLLHDMDKHYADQYVSP